ncbi:hypothetical protein CspeluHIS016_0302470 [Cutaneotrichosporon spelunceum]|uniref:Uncharacterized protein n=1 Tax=Cutaneotrichosporon spelunceum TaxID=1672016 RepID=A0AAD3YBY9_9TREE|nr:hypothetical protein CspeluHIS016_0302470 [Cutaneotrichosporon spelunceum]
MDDDWVSVTPPGPEQVREQPVSDVLSGGYVIPNVRVGMLEQDEALGRLRLDQDSTLHTLHTLEQMNAALTAENARLKRALALHENDIIDAGTGTLT